MAKCWPLCYSFNFSLCFKMFTEKFKKRNTAHISIYSSQYFSLRKEKKDHLVWGGRKRQRKLKRIGDCLEKSRKKNIFRERIKNKKDKALERSNISIQ